MLDRDGVERFETVNDSETLSVLLDDTKPSGSVCGVRGFVDTGVHLLSDYCTNSVIESGWYRNILLDPRRMWNDWELNRREEVCSESAALEIGSCKTLILDRHEVME